MDDSFDSFDVMDDSFDDDETKENDSDFEHHDLLHCYRKAKRTCTKILRILRIENLRGHVLLENMDKYRALKERFPSNEIYKEMDTMIIRLINMLYNRKYNVRDMEALVLRKIEMFDSKMSDINGRLNRYVDSSACTDMTSSINNTYNINYESSTPPQRFTL